MTITINKPIQVEETVNIEFPSYFLMNTVYHKLTEQVIAKIYDNSIFCTPAKTPSGLENDYYKAQLTDLLTKGELVSAEKFNEEFYKTSEKINELAGFSNLPTLQLQEA